MLVACDLDQTLIYTRRSLGVDPEPPLLCVEVYEGAPLSFVTTRAADLLVELAAVATVVPTTTRTRAQLGRVSLPGASRYAVAANGGHLLVDGEPDPDWAATVRAALAAVAGLAVVDAGVRADPALCWLAAGLRPADDLFLYSVVDRAAATADAVAPLAARLRTEGWTVSVQGRKVYLVPEPLTKLAAVREVQARTGDTVLAAVGDSLLDRDLLAAADVAARPPHGELHAAGWTCPGLVVTDRPGAVAAEDLLRRLLDAAG